MALFANLTINILKNARFEQQMLILMTQIFYKEYFFKFFLKLLLQRLFSVL